MNQLCKTAAEVVVEVRGTEKSAGWFSNPKSFFIRGFFLNQEGYILTCKDFLEDFKDFKVCWNDRKGSIHLLDATVISKHPTENAAILKVEYPYGGKFPQCSCLFESFKVHSWYFMLVVDNEPEEEYPMAGKILNIFQEEHSYSAMLTIPSIVGGSGSPIFDFNGFIIGFQDSVFIKNRFVCATSLLYIKKWMEETLDSMPDIITR
jgi:hypothetical protein